MKQALQFLLKYPEKATEIRRISEEEYKLLPSHNKSQNFAQK